MVVACCSKNLSKLATQVQQAPSTQRFFLPATQRAFLKVSRATSPATGCGLDFPHLCNMLGKSAEHGKVHYSLSCTLDKCWFNLHDIWSSLS